MTIEQYLIFIWCMFGFLDFLRKSYIEKIGFTSPIGITAILFFWTIGGPIMLILRKVDR